MYAHSLPHAPESEWQRLEEHLGNVASRAESFGRRAGIGVWAELAGRWHDLGKHSAAFQDYIQTSTNRGDAVRHGTVDHSTAGAKHAYSQYGDIALPLSYAIAGHHGGLPNWFDETDAHLKGRLDRDVPDWSAAPHSVLQTDHVDASSLPFAPDRDRLGVQIFLFIKMLYSSLVDADFLDTELFMDRRRGEERAHPWRLHEMKKRLDAYLEQLERDARGHGNGSGEVNRTRAYVLDSCKDAAASPPGFFSLTVPTGGGKTLSSLSFAIDHAIRHEMERIIYAIPYTSIIEQNAAVFRTALGLLEGRTPVLEHHSNFDSKRDDRWSRLASENWDSNLVVTTNVQLLESLFHHKPSANRKVHNVARSVIILDEAQMLPPTLLEPTLAALQELVDTYHCSIVLCTATQPALHYSAEFPIGVTGVREIIPDVAHLYRRLRRTQIENAGVLGDEHIVDAITLLGQVLVVVNTRTHARGLFEMLRSRGGEDIFHLSALMYPRHRSRVISEIRQRLIDGLPARVISTQLIEAGVDIDFPVVYRAMAGVDSIAQAAGRCNREGRLAEGGRVVVFTPADRGIPRQFRAAVSATEDVAREHGDLLSPAAVEDFFRGYYWRGGESAGHDKPGIMSKLAPSSAARFHIPFRDIGESYKVIDSSAASVIVDCGGSAEDGRRVADLLRELEHAASGREILRSLQSYTVQVYEHTLRKLVSDAAVSEVRPGVYVLNNPRAYDEQLGLIEDDAGVRDPESIMA